MLIRSNLLLFVSLTSTALSLPHDLSTPNPNLELRSVVTPQHICASKEVKPAPQGATCGKAGHLAKDINWWSPGGLIKKDYCGTLCLDDPDCKAISYHAAWQVCTIYTQTLQKGKFTTKKPDPDTLWSERACFKPTKFGDMYTVRNGDFQTGSLEPWQRVDYSDGYSSTDVTIEEPPVGGGLTVRLAVYNTGPNTPSAWIQSEFRPCLGKNYTVEFDYFRGADSEGVGCLQLQNEAGVPWNSCWTDQGPDSSGSNGGQWVHISTVMKPSQSPTLPSLALVASGVGTQYMFVDNFKMWEIRW